jgi:hypothetical protein
MIVNGRSAQATGQFFEGQPEIVFENGSNEVMFFCGRSDLQSLKVLIEHMLKSTPPRQTPSPGNTPPTADSDPGAR